MPELPDVEGYRRAAADAVGAKVVAVEVRRSWAARGLAPRALKRLEGRSIRGARRHGKHLFLVFDEGPLLAMHFGMGGRLELQRDQGEPPLHSVVLLKLERGGRLVYVNDRLGAVGLAPDVETFVRERRLGPDALAMPEDRFAAALRARRGSVKSALMDQSLVAGIGNVYSDEILFQARVSPLERADRISAQRVGELHGAMRRTLETAARADGEWKRLPESYLLRRRRKGSKCGCCAATIETAGFSGRTAYFCPSCQPRPKGALAAPRRSARRPSGRRSLSGPEAPAKLRS